MYNYAKGLIPGWLAGVASLACNFRIMRGYRDGMAYLFVSCFVIAVPTIFAAIEIFLYFSFFMLILILVYWGLLFLSKNGKSSWGIAIFMPKRLNWMVWIVGALWCEMIIAGVWTIQKLH